MGISNETVTAREAVTAARIFASIGSDLERTRRELEKQVAVIEGAALPPFESFTSDAVHHLFRRRGKYLRPSLVLLSARAVDAPADDDVLVRVGAAIELIHSASLVHDDVIDESDKRRGQPSLNSTVGNKAAILTGDLLYDQAFALLADLPELCHMRQLELFRSFTSTTRKMCLGEMYEDRIAADPQGVSFADYLKVIDYKTASLMACSCAASAIAVGVDSDTRARLEEYGSHLGVSYQLIDDVEDGDSIYYERSSMLDLAMNEAGRAEQAVSFLRKSAYRDRLVEMPQILLRRAESSVATAADR